MDKSKTIKDEISPDRLNPDRLNEGEVFYALPVKAYDDKSKTVTLFNDVKPAIFSQDYGPTCFCMCRHYGRTGKDNGKWYEREHGFVLFKGLKSDLPADDSEIEEYLIVGKCLYVYFKDEFMTRCYEKVNFVIDEND